MDSQRDKLKINMKIEIATTLNIVFYDQMVCRSIISRSASPFDFIVGLIICTKLM